MVELIRRIAAQAGQGQAPARLMFAAVTVPAPLTLLVDSRFELSGEALVVPLEYRNTAWRAGDRVVLLRDHGGQQFYLLGRM